MTRVFAWASSWLEEVVDRRDVVSPTGHFSAESRAPFRGERVVLRAAVVLGQAPLGVDRTGVLEPIQRLVERRVDDAEIAAGALVDPLADGEPVHRLPGERAEDEQVERAVEEVLRLDAHSSST